MISKHVISGRGQPSPDTRRRPRVDEVAVEDVEETMPVSCETSLSETILPEKE
jgi:hypothetical protein